MPNFTHIYRTVSSQQHLMQTNPVKAYPAYPLANPAGYSAPNPAITRKLRADFQPLRRTEETSSELSSSVVEQPLVMEDYVDLEGEF
jgi:hypothetical protein